MLTLGRKTARADSLRLRDGAALWRSEDRPYAAGDQDGQPGVELVQDLSGAVVQSPSGADLGLRWRR